MRRARPTWSTGESLTVPAIRVVADVVARAGPSSAWTDGSDAEESPGNATGIPAAGTTARPNVSSRVFIGPSGRHCIARRATDDRVHSPRARNEQWPAALELASGRRRAPSGVLVTARLPLLSPSQYCHAVHDKSIDLTEPEAVLEHAVEHLTQVTFLQSVGVDGGTPDGRYPILRLTDREGRNHRLIALLTGNGPSTVRRGMTSGDRLAVRNWVRDFGQLPREEQPQSSAMLIERSRDIASALREQAHSYGAELGAIVVGRFIDAELGAMLRSKDVNYVDTGGNLHLELADGRFVAHVEGQKPRSRSRPRATSLRAAGYRVLFAILVRPDLLRMTVREIERCSGASRQAVSELFARLREEGGLTRGGRSHHQFVPGRRAELIARFVSGWTDAVRPTLLIGSFRRREQGSVDADAEIERTLANHAAGWGFGGTAGAMRLAPHFRGADTVLHVADWNDDASRALGLAPDRTGPIRIYRKMGELDLVATPSHCAHPLLVYAELATSGDERAREAARAVRDALLGDAGS
jgi:hypothetical protein